nr:hypothetical protein [Thiocapsa sp. KS1]
MIGPAQILLVGDDEGLGVDILLEGDDDRARPLGIAARAFRPQHQGTHPAEIPGHAGIGQQRARGQDALGRDRQPHRGESPAQRLGERWRRW